MKACVDVFKLWSVQINTQLYQSEKIQIQMFLKIYNFNKFNGPLRKISNINAGLRKLS